MYLALENVHNYIRCYQWVAIIRILAIIIRGLPPHCSFRLQQIWTHSQPQLLSWFRDLIRSTDSWLFSKIPPNENTQDIWAEHEIWLMNFQWCHIDKFRKTVSILEATVRLMTTNYIFRRTHVWRRPICSYLQIIKMHCDFKKATCLNESLNVYDDPIVITWFSLLSNTHEWKR